MSLLALQEVKTVAAEEGYRPGTVFSGCTVPDLEGQNAIPLVSRSGNSRMEMSAARRLRQENT